MIKELFSLFFGGLKYLKTYIPRHFKEDYDEFINWLITD